MRDRLIVALDLPTPDDAAHLVVTLGDSVEFYKIGLELVYGGGLPLAERLAGEGKKVFLDLKLHDIPATVERAAAQVARLGATFLTVHAFPQTMRAAKAGVGDDGPAILGVTVMTSYDDCDLESAGYAIGVRDLVARRADQAVEAGIDGLILSAEEVESMRRRVGSKLKLVTPGYPPPPAPTRATRNARRRPARRSPPAPIASSSAGPDHARSRSARRRRGDPRRPWPGTP